MISVCPYKEISVAGRLSSEQEKNRQIGASHALT